MTAVTTIMSAESKLLESENNSMSANSSETLNMKTSKPTNLKENCLKEKFNNNSMNSNCKIMDSSNNDNINGGAVPVAAASPLPSPHGSGSNSKSNPKEAKCNNVKKEKQKGKQKKEKTEKKGSKEEDFEEMNDGYNHKNDSDLLGMPEWVIDLMEYQPTLNIMTIGDVSHGKSTLMWGLCEEKTGRHSSEVKKNMTIKLGYTSCKIYKCINCQNSKEICYFSVKSQANSKQVKCPRCGVKQPFIILVRHISFVDCPGHAEYMGTMISATCVADGAIMVIDASRKFPGEQTVQHTAAAHLLGVLTKDMEERKNSENDGNEDRIKVIVAQNKIDLIDKQKACQNVTQIRQFLSHYDKELSLNTPIIPISAQSRLNLDALCCYMVQKYPKFSPRLMSPNDISSHSLAVSKATPNLVLPKGQDSLEINIIRSFDVNKPCDLSSIEDIDKKIHGGVLGGVIIRGQISIGDTVCIRPGIVTNVASSQGTVNSLKDKVNALMEARFVYRPIESKVIGLKCGSKSLKTAYPGANVGVMLNIDPSLTKHDLQKGNIVCNVDNGKKDGSNEFRVFSVFVMSYVLLKPFDKHGGFKMMEGIKVNVGSWDVLGFVVQNKCVLPGSKSKGIMVATQIPMCAKVSSECAISRKINNTWRLAAGGVIFKVKECRQQQSN